MAGTADGGAIALHAAKLSTPDLSPQLTAVYQVFLHTQRFTVKKNLDSMLRSDPTGVDVEDHPSIRRDKRRLYVLQRELQRACLTATLLNLPVARRAGFILIEVLRFSEDEVARILGTSSSAVHTAVGRARRDLTTYLESRCEHMDPRNPCHCETRLGIALERGFIQWPDRDDLPGDEPLVSRAVCLDAERLYAKLPSPLPAPRGSGPVCR